MRACSVAQLCLTFCDPMDADRILSPWDSSGKNTGVDCHFLLQGIFPTQGSSNPPSPMSPAVAGRIFTTEPPGKPSLCLERGNSKIKKTSKEAIFQARDDGALNQGGGDKNCLDWGYILKTELTEFVDGLVMGYEKRVEVGSYCSLEPEQLDQRFCYSLKWLILREELVLVGIRVRGSVSDTLSFRCLLDTLFE